MPICHFAGLCALAVVAVSTGVLVMQSEEEATLAWIGVGREVIQ